jgi:hypothetical protein
MFVCNFFLKVDRIKSSANSSFIPLNLTLGCKGLMIFSILCGQLRSTKPLFVSSNHSSISYLVCSNMGLRLIEH